MVRALLRGSGPGPLAALPVTERVPVAPILTRTGVAPRTQVHHEITVQMIQVDDPCDTDYDIH